MKTITETISPDKLHIDRITKQFFDIFNNSNQKQPGWEIINETCIPETMIIKKTGLTQTVYNLVSFIEPRKAILSDGTLTQFEESEIDEETKIAGHIAQRWSKYQKTGYLNGKYFKEYGTKLFQFIKTKEGWMMSSLIWEDDKT